MFFEGNNSFITLSYFMTGLVFLLALLWVWLDGRQLKQSLKKLPSNDPPNPQD